MKKTYLLLSIIILSFSSAAFSQAVATKIGIYTVMTNRCSRYLTGSEKEDCKNSVDRTLDILDFDVKFQDEAKKSFVFIAFKKNLVNFLSLPETQNYLTGLQAELTKFLTGTRLRPLSIWDFTVKFYQSESRSREVIAALFQDISTRKLHLAYLDYVGTRGNEFFQHNKEYSGLVIDTIHQITQVDNGDYRPHFYPGDLGHSLNSNIYHFYVPAYLTARLLKEGHSKFFSRVGPLMMTMTYEFITAGKDTQYLFSDPARIESATEEGVWKVQDIYGGYSGGLFGMGAKNNIKPFETVQKAFDRSTREGAQALLSL